MNKNFFSDLSRFENRLALIDCASGLRLTYIELEDRVSEAVIKLGDRRELVFIEAKNDIVSTVFYLAALRSNKVIYLLDCLDDDKSQVLRDVYQPNLLIKNGEITKFSEKEIEFHPDLTLLLSTSGSTGTPKFVKLSKKNIQSNAESIAQYLNLSPDDNALSHLKLHYSYGLSILHSHLVVGATVSYTHYGVLDSGFWNHLSEYSATSFAGVPYTFESMIRQGFDLSLYSTLRYITQAGGKLEPSIVQQFTKLSQGLGIEFYVMYGQTEASPRISYLPPELAFEFSNCIGQAIPGGTLSLLDEAGNEIIEYDQPGELAYQGDNVMMGYAEGPDDFLCDDTPSRLLTGDIACKTKYGLYYIVGRTKRFVKLFGLRLNLDEIQSYVKAITPNSAVTGTDEVILVVVENNQDVDLKGIQKELSIEYGIPQSNIEVKSVSSLPLLSSGKYDYKGLWGLKEDCRKPWFLRLFHHCMVTLGLENAEWESIESLFGDALNIEDLNTSLCLADLEFDSLSFVYLSVELESCLKDSLPINWQDIPISDLETLYSSKRYE